MNLSKKRFIETIKISLICCLFLGNLVAQSGGGYDLSHNVIAGGGEKSSIGNFSLEGTVGQGAAGSVSYDSTSSLFSGFWFSLFRANQTIDFAAIADKAYGDASFDLTATATSNLLVSFTASGDCSVSGTTVTLTGAGNCTITASQDGTFNYNPAPEVEQSFSISKASLSVTPNNQSITYNDSYPSFTYLYAGFVYGEDAGVIDTQAICGVSGSPTDAGTYTITCSGAADDNYDFVYNTATLIINKADQTISFGGLSDKTYGDSAFIISATASSGLTVSFAASGDCTISGSTVIITGAGNCTITASQSGNANYNAATDVNQNFNIGKAALTVTAEDQTITYGDPAPAFTFNYNGFVVPDTSADIDTPPTCNIAGAYTDAGSYTIACSGGVDDNYQFNYVDGTLLVNKAALTITADDKSSQYSDPLETLTWTANGFVNGDNAGVISGSPSLSTTAASTSEPNTYGITIGLGTLSAANYDFNLVNGTYTITREDARAYYTGSMFVSTSCTSCDDATVTLIATIKDITAVNGDPATDAYAGDIRNADVHFVIRDNSDNVVANIPATINLVSASDPTTGTALSNWDYLLPGNSDSETFNIEVVIDGYYTGVTDTSGNADSLVTISRPLGDNFITGGGYLLLENSVGQYQGTIGTRSNFGFNVKYNKRGNNLQGRLNLVFRSAGRRYQIKGNVMNSLTTNNKNSDPRTAVYTGKANLRDITDPDIPISITGNLIIQVELTDRGEPGSNDSIAFTVWDNSGLLIYSSNWNGIQTIEQMLDGGNLVIR